MGLASELDFEGRHESQTKPVIEQAADTVNDAVEEITLKAADAAVEPDAEHVAATTHEQVYIPEVTRKSHCQATLTQSRMVGLLVNGKNTSSKL
jgi:hypothetical protein